MPQNYTAMASKKLKDNHGILRKTKKDLPDKYYKDLLKTLAELEDQNCYDNKVWPHTGLHPLKGVKQSTKDAIYECYIHKTSGWRFQVKYDGDYISIVNLTAPNEHDRVEKVVSKKKNNF